MNRLLSFTPEPFEMDTELAGAPRAHGASGGFDRESDFEYARGRGPGASARSRRRRGPHPAPYPATSATPFDSQAFRQKMVRIANQELARWGNGAIKETDPRIRRVLQDYWKTGVGASFNDAQLSDPAFQKAYPWSAAFISWVMRTAGAGNAFNYSSAHADYTRAAIDNRLANNSNPFKAYRIAELAPQVGDLVCTSRNGSGAAYDNVKPGMKTHCDIVTEVRPGSLVTVGGNVGHSVKQTTLPTDANGRIAKPDYFAVIRIGGAQTSVPVAPLPTPGPIPGGGSKDTRWIQAALNKILGLRLAVDGVMGAATRSAIRAFQKRRGLTADGVVGPKTRAAMIAAGAPKPGGTAQLAAVASCPPQVANVDCPAPGAPPDTVLEGFVFDRTSLLPAHEPLLTALAGRVIAAAGSRRPVETILIAGHTDPVGGDDYNFQLGWRRAREALAGVCRTLERMRPGITGRIKFDLTSCGERQPRATAEQSRRVEIFLRKKAVPPPPPPRPKCRFRPSLHGLKFVNSFTLPSAITTPLSRLGVPIGSGAYGLCGGMSFLAADHFNFGVPIPATTAIPGTGTPLYNKILVRQIDSLQLSSISLDFGAPVLKFHRWMGLPDRGSGGVAALTLAEFRGASTALRRGRPVVLGLALARYPGGSLTENHQVLAYCMRGVSPTRFEIDIYDPNFPLRDDVKIQVDVVGAEASCAHLAGGRRSPVRGFFVMPYSPKRP